MADVALDLTTGEIVETEIDTTPPADADVHEPSDEPAGVLPAEDVDALKAKVAAATNMAAMRAALNAVLDTLAAPPANGGA